FENISKDLNSKNKTPGSSSKNIYELEEKLNPVSDLFIVEPVPSITKSIPLIAKSTPSIANQSKSQVDKQLVKK
ncbi:432_t:CDS:2, partial [Funneliformis geosporum]